MWHTEKYGDIGYIRIEGEAAEAISAHELVRRLELGRRRGFGSVKVNARIGDSRWSTSVFPQRKAAGSCRSRKRSAAPRGSRKATKSRWSWSCSQITPRRRPGSSASTELTA